MLREILVRGYASYSNDGQQLGNLRPVNFIFGTNGTGKTTLSRLIASPASYPNCQLVWREDRPHDCLVYNSDFTAQNLASKMPGIFTLGSDNVEAIQLIDAARDRIKEHLSHISARQGTLSGTDGKGGKRKDLADLRSTFEESCWKAKSKYEPHFQEAFTGVRGKKSSFCDKVLNEQQTNQSSLRTEAHLRARALVVFEKGLGKIDKIAVPPCEELLALETEAVLNKKVVGKEDVNIAALIRRLGNSDWVRQGLTYVEPTDMTCPFCQKSLESGLYKEISEYFDEEYVRDVADIDRIYTSYLSYSSSLSLGFEAIFALENRYVDALSLRTLVDRLLARIETNKRHLERKKREASSKVRLDACRPLTEEITTIIASANKLIDDHNKTVDNIFLERISLYGEIWRLLLTESASLVSEYVSKSEIIRKAIEGLEKGITSKNTEISKERGYIKELERTITSVQPTVNEINSILSSFGFTNFKLATAGENESLYEIVRGDGESAGKTLSEGEKSFISFLYFYHLIRGSTHESGATTDRIVVFDDPVSSLDSDVLFIVSSLVRKTIDEACKGSSFIKQVFVLTHNIYFHKEVSFDSKRSGGCRAHETFWIVRKVAGVSEVTSYNHNPIKTSYELLWSEVKNENRSNLTIQNTLRRIVENYFKILGNTDPDKIVERFDGQEKIICGSLFSWVNDGSHSAHDDLYISVDDTAVEMYLQVFRNIFVHTGHEGHYKMMMGEEP